MAAHVINYVMNCTMACTNVRAHMAINSIQMAIVVKVTEIHSFFLRHSIYIMYTLQWRWLIISDTFILYLIGYFVRGWLKSIYMSSIRSQSCEHVTLSDICMVHVREHIIHYAQCESVSIIEHSMEIWLSILLFISLVSRPLRPTSLPLPLLVSSGLTCYLDSSVK